MKSVPNDWCGNVGYVCQVPSLTVFHTAMSRTLEIHIARRVVFGRQTCQKYVRPVRASDTAEGKGMQSRTVFGEASAADVGHWCNVLKLSTTCHHIRVAAFITIWSRRVTCIVASCKLRRRCSSLHDSQ